MKKSRIYLASKSEVRKKLLSQAGIDVITAISKCEESKEKSVFLSNSENSIHELAMFLAQKKVLHTSVPGNDLVIGCDQTAICEGKYLSKAKTREEAREKLLFLRGKTHQLVSAIAVARNNQIVFSLTKTVSLTMRVFSDNFLESYIDKLGDDLYKTAGGYFLEKEGIQLFSSIDGDYFSILGLPLIELCEFLRTENILEL